MIIYKITNKINGKVYIGQTIQSLTKRWGEHCYDCVNDRTTMPLHRAMKKYGVENFTIEQIDVTNNREELDEKERQWIKHYNATDKNHGYNLTEGGLHHEATIEFREKMSKLTSGKNNGMFDKKHSKEAINKMRKKKSEEARKKMSEAAKNRVISDETKLKISNTLKQLLSSKEVYNCKKVLCVETNEIFNSMNKAAKQYNISRTSIWQVCNGIYGHKTAGGYHWRYHE